MANIVVWWQIAIEQLLKVPFGRLILGLWNNGYQIGMLKKSLICITPSRLSTIGIKYSRLGVQLHLTHNIMYTYQKNIVVKQINSSVSCRYLYTHLTYKIMNLYGNLN